MRFISFKTVPVFFFLIFTGAGGLHAQSAVDLRINEFLVYNDSNYVDDFGEHSPWIEIFNSAYNTVDIGGLYLTDDLSMPAKYKIAAGQPVTQIPPRSYVVFWADNMPTRGILHLNFSLREGKTIALFDVNGRTLIDSVSIPHTVLRNVTYGRMADGGSGWGILDKSTPNANNDTADKITAGEQFKQMDPSGLGMTVIAMSIVFVALALLFLFFKYLVKVIGIDVKKQRLARAKIRAKAGAETWAGGDDTEGLELSGEINAAIAMTLYLYSVELHDTENAILTINKVSRTYSPWSSKIYGLNRLPK